MTQGFAKNFNSSYAKDGLKGHTGWDFVLGYKSPIQAVTDGEVYSTREPTSNVDRYTAVYQIVDEQYFSYEVSYGHLAEIKVKKGEMVRVGDTIGLEGNFGLCYRNGVKVTPAQKKLGWGSHLHFQIRKCKRVEKKEKGKTYLRDNSRYLKRNNMYYEVVDYDNGFNGCVDPNLFIKISLAKLLDIFALLRKLGILK